MEEGRLRGADHLLKGVKMRCWQVNQNSVSVDYGPPTLSLKIKERYEQKDSRTTAIGDSHWQKNADASKWPSYEIYADSPRNYALCIRQDGSVPDFEVIKRAWPSDDFPFSLTNTPLEFKAKGAEWPPGRWIATVCADCSRTRMHQGLNRWTTSRSCLWERPDSVSQPSRQLKDKLSPIPAREEGFMHALTLTSS